MNLLVQFFVCSLFKVVFNVLQVRGLIMVDNVRGVEYEWRGVQG